MSDRHDDARKRVPIADAASELGGSMVERMRLACSYLARLLSTSLLDGCMRSLGVTRGETEIRGGA